MSKILKNNTAGNIIINDTGVTVLASSSYTIPPQDYLLWAASSDIITKVGDSLIVVNDGSYDLSISAGIDLIKGIFPSSVSITGETTVTVNAETASENIAAATILNDILIELKIINKAISLSLLNGDRICEEDV